MAVAIHTTSLIYHCSDTTNKPPVPKEYVTYRYFTQYSLLGSAISFGGFCFMFVGCWFFVVLRCILSRIVLVFGVVVCLVCWLVFVGFCVVVGCLC